MNSHLRKDLQALRDRLLKVAIAVEENMRKSLRAVSEMSVQLGEEAVTADLEIDRMEVETEEECMKILALHQPVAGDLRFVVGVLKINGELEHIGDMAANIAKRIHFISDEPRIECPFAFETMTSRVIYMLKSSIDAFLEGDSKLAIGVCEDDEIVDEENRKCYINARRLVSEKPEWAMAVLNYIFVSKSLERIADLCTNIAEDVIYMKHCIIARHNLALAKWRIDSEEDCSEDK